MDRRTYLASLAGATLGATAIAGCLTHDGDGDDEDPLETDAASLLLTPETMAGVEDRWEVTDERDGDGEGASVTIKPQPDEEPIVDVEATTSLEQAVVVYTDTETDEQLYSGAAVYADVEAAQAEWNDSVQELAGSFLVSELPLGVEGYGLNSTEPFMLFRDAEAVGFVRHRDPRALEEAEDDDDDEPEGPSFGDEENEDFAGGDAELAIEYAEAKHDQWR